MLQAMEWISLTNGLVAIAVLIAFFVQGITGFGATLIAFPILLIQFSFSEAIAIMSLFLVLFSILLIPKNWKDMDQKMVSKMAMSILIGMVIGVQILKYADPSILKQLFGGFVVFYVLYKIKNPEAIQGIKNYSTSIGFIGGLFSGLFSSGGPFIVAYMHNFNIPSKTLRATLIGIFGITNFSRIPLLIQSGVLTTDNAIYALAGIPSFFLGLLIAHKSLPHINEEAFKKIILTLLFVSGITILIN